MAQTIAVANMKGGVGKTTISAMLAEALAHNGKRVLLIDLDAQGSLSFALMGHVRFEETVKQERTISTYFSERAEAAPKPLSAYITSRASLLPSCTSLDLIAAEPQLQSIERRFIGDLSRFAIADPLKQPEEAASKWITKELRALSSAYDVIIFDCPPGISIFAFAGIQNSAKVIVPATPDYLSMLAIRSMHEHTLPAAFRTRPKKARPEILLLLNKCSGTSKAPATYRKKILEFIESSKWSARLADMMIPQKQKMQNAMEADEERKWKKFTDKYDEADTIQMVQELIG